MPPTLPPTRRSSPRAHARRAASRVAFRALLLRDLVVLRKKLQGVHPPHAAPAVPARVRVHVRVPEDRPGRRRARAATSEFSTLLVAGVIGLAIIFQGIQSVALPMVQEFGYTREIEDRVLAPLPVVAGRDREGRSPARSNGLFAALLVFPIAAIVPATPVHLDVELARCCSRSRRSRCYMCGALGLTFGTRFEPRTVPMLFGIIVLPLTFLGAIYYSWSSLEADPVAADPRAREPARLHVRRASAPRSPRRRT